MDRLISEQAVMDAIEFEDKWLLDAKSHNENTKIAFDGLKSKIKAIPSADKWIPVSEKLPEENTDVLLGLRNGDKFKCFVSRRVDYNYWVSLGRDISDEIRWMPLPKPYGPQEGADE